MVVAFEGDGNLNIAVSLAGDETMIRIFSINPTDIPAKFDECGSTLIRIRVAPAWRMHLCGKFLLLRCMGELFVIWDYVNSRFAKWAFEKSRFDVDEVVLTGSHVLHLGEKCVSIWKLSSVATLSATLPRGEAFHADTQLREVDPDWTIPYPFQTPVADGPMERFLSPVHSVVGSLPSVTFDICEHHRYADKPTAFHRYTVSYACADGPTPLTPDHISTGYFPVAFFDTHRTRLVKRRVSANGVDVPCITGKLSITAPERQWHTFLYGPNECTKEVDMGETGESTWPRDKEGGAGAMATPLEPYLPVASCAASGRFIYRKRNVEAIFLAEYL